MHIFASSRERVCAPKEATKDENNDNERRTAASVASTLESPRLHQTDDSEEENKDSENGPNKPNQTVRSLLKSASISASKCIGVKAKTDLEVIQHHVHYIYSLSGLSLMLAFIMNFGVI